MEISFCDLKKMETVNLADGKRLGKVCDVVFTFPEGRVQGIVVPGGKGFRWGKADMFIDIKNIVKIGEDVVLVELRGSSPPNEPKKDKWDRPNCPPPPPPKPPPRDRRDYGDYE